MYKVVQFSLESFNEKIVATFKTQEEAKACADRKQYETSPEDELLFTVEKMEAWELQ